MGAHTSQPENPSDAAAQIVEKLSALTEIIKKLDGAAARAESAAANAENVVKSAQQSGNSAALRSGLYGSILGSLLTGIVAYFSINAQSAAAIKNTQAIVDAAKTSAEAQIDAAKTSAEAQIDAAKTGAEAQLEAARKSYEAQLAVVKESLKNAASNSFETIKGSQYAEALKKIKQAIIDLQIGFRESAFAKGENKRLSNAILELSNYVLDDKFRLLPSLTKLHDESALLTGAYSADAQAWQTYESTQRQKIETLCEKAVEELNAWAQSPK